MGGSEDAVLARPTNPVWAFYEALFVDGFSTEGYLASAWQRIEGALQGLDGTYAFGGSGVSTLCRDGWERVTSLSQQKR